MKPQINIATTNITTSTSLTSLNRKFGLITGGVLLVLFFYSLIFHRQYGVVIGVIGSSLILFALIKPLILNPLRKVWDKVGMILGIINTSIILSLLFFLVLTPLGCLMRLMNKNVIDLKWNKSKSTYWETTPANPEHSLQKQF